MPNFSLPPPTVTALSKEISLDYGRTGQHGRSRTVYTADNKRLKIIKTTVS